MRGWLACLLAVALGACAEARPAAPAPAPSSDGRSSDWQSMQEKVSRSSRGLRVEQMGNGVRKVALQGRFQHVAVVERASSGAAQRACVDRPMTGF